MIKLRKKRFPERKTKTNKINKCWLHQRNNYLKPKARNHKEENEIHSGKMKL